MKKIKKNPFAVGLVLSVILGVAFSFVPQEASARMGRGRIPCNSNAESSTGFYVDCSGCVRVNGTAIGGQGKCRRN